MFSFTATMFGKQNCWRKHLPFQPTDKTLWERGESHGSRWTVFGAAGLAADWLSARSPSLRRIAFQKQQSHTELTFLSLWKSHVSAENHQNDASISIYSLYLLFLRKIFRLSHESNFHFDRSDSVSCIPYPVGCLCCNRKSRISPFWIFFRFLSLAKKANRVNARTAVPKLFWPLCRTRNEPRITYYMIHF